MSFLTRPYDTGKDDPQTIAVESGRLLRELEEFVASAVWGVVKESSEKAIRANLHHFEQGAGEDPQFIRGYIKACRSLLTIPDQYRVAIEADNKAAKYRITTGAI